MWKQPIMTTVHESLSETENEPVFLDPNAIAAYLAETGPFAAFFERYEQRTSQLNLVRAITACFNRKAIGIFEAGTGVGKSLAYLLPALTWAKATRKRIVISTGTINLQYQLVEKDVPTARKIIPLHKPEDTAVLLIKGRQNYLCMRRFSQTLQEADLFTEYQQELTDIQAWIQTTQEGTRSELPFMPAQSLWNKICSESDNCLSQRCAFFDRCFVMKLKKKAERASVLIVNHHLLCADLASRREGIGYESTAVLPSFSAIIFDEAHTLEQAATSFFSYTFSRFELNRCLTSLSRVKKGRDFGCLSKIAARSSRADLLPEILNNLTETQLCFSAMEAAATLFCGIATNLGFPQASPKKVQDLLVRCRSCYAAVQKTLQNLSTLFTHTDTTEDSSDDTMRDGLLAFHRLQTISETLASFLEWEQHSDCVFWIELLRTTNDIPTPYFHKTPIDMAPILRKSVFHPFETVICTSATLTVSSSFSYWLQRMGLQTCSKDTLLTDTFASPFPYRTNVLLNIPTDAPLPDDIHFQSFINKAVTELIAVTCGKTLVLFTSYASLKATYAYVHQQLPEMELLQQGDMDRSKLLQQFKANINSSLFATASFWAGIDVPGESLTHVILVKLPFSVPNDPLFRARADIIEQNGGNSFLQLSIPEAVVQFRQGFGRLMRRQTDRGMVTVLDKRLLVKTYGKIFIESIPTTKRCFASLKEILYTTERFLYWEPRKTSVFRGFP
ncbi:MAG: ATP-dependent DNA helicase [Treponema sp.]